MFGFSLSSFSIVGFASLQCGHCRSLNSTMVTGASAGPRAGPVTFFANSCRISSNGCLPKGIMSPTTACFPSAATKNFCAPCPCGPLICTFTSAKPSALLGSILAIFQVTWGSYPKVSCRKAFTASSEGRLVAALGSCRAGTLDFVLECVAGFGWAPAAVTRINSTELATSVRSISFLYLDVGFGGYRETSSITKSFGRNFYSLSRLLAFVFVSFNNPDHTLDQIQ